MKKVRFFLDPMERLGHEKYSLFFPVIGSGVFLYLIDLIVVNDLINSSFSSALIIASSIVLLVYFSFRDGIRAGVITILIVVGYYFYIILTRLEPQQVQGALNTTLLLGLLYLGIGVIIGWLKQSLDKLIQKEKAATILADEERLRLKSVLEQLPVAVRIANLKEKRIEGNRKFEDLFKRKLGGDLDKEIKYIAEHEYKNGKKLNVDDLALVKSMKSKKKLLSEEIEYVRDDRKRLFLKVSAVPVFNKNRKVISVVSVLTDITEEKEQAKRKDNFISMASHELRTPITTIRLYLDLLSKRIQTYGDESFLKLIGNLIVQTERLQQLSSDLLDVSRIQTGKLHFIKQDFLLNELVAEVCSLFQQTSHNKKITVEESGPIVVTGDRFRIYQVLTNLLTNAIKYSEKDTEIIVKTRKVNENVEISVQDFGIGIDPSQRRKIFNLLYQVEDSTEKTFPGLGMGLFISREIVKQHSGKIWVDGEKGKGSTFHFTIPLGGQK